MNTHYYNICARAKQSSPRLLLLAVLLTVVGGLHAQERNVLTIPDFEAGINKTVYVPIHLENTQEVVAAQFDVQLPFAAPEDGTPTISNRANQHSVTINAKGSKNFTVIVMSMKNNALRGNSGLLLRLPMYTYDDGSADSSYPITLTNVVLTDRNGNNIATDQEPVVGYYSVSRAELPDLTVRSIVPQTTETAPEGLFSVSYVVENIGQAATKAGWTEKVYFKSALTGTNVYIGSQSYAGTLEGNNAQLQRTFTATLPSLIHADGTQQVYVEIIPLPATGELTSDQGNNSSVSEQTVEVSKRLYVSASKLSIREGWLTGGWGRYNTYSYRDNIALTISRSGDWSTAESFSVYCDVDNLLYVDSESNLLHPSPNAVSITIEAGVASKTVYVYTKDDAIVRSREATIFVGPDNGYAQQSVAITRVEDDVNPLSLTASAAELTEGPDKVLRLTLTRGGELTDKATFTISCSEPLRFEESFPIKVVLDAPTPTTTIDLHLVNDGIPQFDKNVKFTASATDYQTANTTIRLLDDDRPQIALTMDPSTVKENDGSTTAIIRRTPAIGRMTVMLSSSNQSYASFANSSVTFDIDENGHPESEKRVQVNITDNSIVDGQRTYTLTAALSTIDGVVSVGDRAASQAMLTVTDDESPYLLLTSNSTYIGEGSSATVTVSRYTPSLSGALTVRLRAEDANDVNIPATVTIPSGSRSTTFTVQVKRNENPDDNGRPLTIYASADGIDDVNNQPLLFTITDRTLPDATCLSVTKETERLYAGMEATFKVEIANVGTAELPDSMQVELLLASSNRLYSYTTTTTLTPVGVTSAAIAHSNTHTFAFTVQLPANMVGTYWLYARLNGNNRIKEFSTSNNTLTTPLQLSIAAPFSVTDFAVDPDSYKAGETVKASGKVSSLVSEALTGLKVQVTMEGPGQSYQSVSCPVTIDPQTGSATFSTTDISSQLTVSSSAYNWLTLKARAYGQTDADKQANINIWNLQLSADKTTWTLDEGYEQTGTLTLRNLSGRPVSNLEITEVSLPYGCHLVIDKTKLQGLTLIANGGKVDLPYTVVGNQSMTDGKYKNFKISVSGHDASNANTAEAVITRDLYISYYCRPTTCQLVFEQSPMNTTLLLESTRTIQLKVTNRGLRETGELTLSVPDNLPWLKRMTPVNMASIQPGKSAYIELELAHQPGMHSGETHSAFITLSSEECATAGVKLNVTIVGTEYSKLNVNVEDIFVKARREYRHVSAAQVSITNARTGEQVMTGLTDGAGYWMTEKITQGTYYVTVSALRHKTVRKQLTIGPGDEQQMKFFLPYQAVLTNFVAEQDEAGTIKLTPSIDIDLTAPQAIVVPELPEEGFECGSQDFDIVLHNRGSFAATGIQFVFPTVADTKFTVGEIPSAIDPGQDALVTVKYEGPEEGKRRTIAKILMYYEFSIAGETYSESDYYQSLVGCSKTNNPPIVDPEDPKPDNPRPDDPDNPEDPEEPYYPGKNEAEPEGPSTDVALPTHNSSVKLEFDDISRITTGTPFTATLRIVNGQDKAFDNLRFVHSVSDDSDGYETDFAQRFTCEQTELQGFASTGGKLSVKGQSEASMRLVFTPLEEATADGTHVYYIGGMLSYTDTALGFASAVALPEVKITVNQLGHISLTYLMQGNFLGDNLTTETQEKSIPGHFVVIMRNEGKSPVSGLHISSSNPVVINSATNEEQHTDPLSAVLGESNTNETIADFSVESIEGESAVAARWMFQSSEDSHYQQETAFGSSVQAQADADIEVTVKRQRKLFRAVSNAQTDDADYDMTDADVVNAALAHANVFLLEDDEKEESAPDHVMLADGSEYPLANVSSNSSVAEQTARVYTLTVNATADGWAYGCINDPVQGMMLLQRVEHNGRVVSAANFWQTDHSVQADFSTVSENKLHFADSLKAGENTYTLTYTPYPDAVTTALGCKLYDADGEEIAMGATIKKRVARIVVNFTNELMTFGKTSFQITVGDKVLSAKNVKVEAVNGDNSTWSIDLTNIEEVAGLHHFYVNASRLKDKATRRYCAGDINAEWTEDLTQTAHVALTVDPGAEAGTIDKESGDYAYGELKLTATPAEGYEFCYWTKNGDRIEDAEATFTYTVDGDAQLTAVFALRTFEIKVVCDESKGVVTGLNLAYYKWHDHLTLTALPNNGYQFSHWEANGEEVSKESVLDITVEDDCTYTVVFKEQPTGIASSTQTEPGVSIYSMNGQLLRHNVSDLREALRSLPEGLYIIGGRKVLNKKR